MQTRRGFHLLLGALTAFVAVLPIASSADAQARSYRITKLALRDPQVIVDPFQSGTACINLTNTPFLGISVNNLIQDYISECEPVTSGQAEPCIYGFNLIATLDPAIQTPGAGGALAQCMSGGAPCEAEIKVLPDCLKSGTSVTCSGAADVDVQTTYSNAGTGQTCLSPHPGTSGINNTTPYNPPVVNPTGPCLLSGAVDFTFEFGSDVVIPIPLKGLQVAATYQGDPATKLVNGLVRGFLPESAADQTVISISTPALDIRLSSALAGGADKCYGGDKDGMPCTMVGEAQCPGGTCVLSCAPSVSNHDQDDRDRNPPDNVNGERGWWFYLEFEAEPVAVQEAPTPTATVTATATLAPPTVTPTVTPRPVCDGDCDGNFSVSISEVQAAAAIFLEKQPLSACSLADADHDGEVQVNEIVRAALSFSNGCP